MQTLVNKPKEITNKQEDKQNNKHIDTSFRLSGGYCCGVVFFIQVIKTLLVQQTSAQKPTTAVYSVPKKKMPRFCSLSYKGFVCYAYSQIKTIVDELH